MPRRPRMTRAALLMAEVADSRRRCRTEAAAKTADEELNRNWPRFNLPADDVPMGVDEHGNVQHHVFGKTREYGFAPKPHDDLGSALGIWISRPPRNCRVRASSS